MKTDIQRKQKFNKNRNSMKTEVKNNRIKIQRK